VLGRHRRSPVTMWESCSIPTVPTEKVGHGTYCELNDVAGEICLEWGAPQIPLAFESARFGGVSANGIDAVLFRYWPLNPAMRICICVPSKFASSRFSWKNEGVIAHKQKHVGRYDIARWRHSASCSGSNQASVGPGRLGLESFWETLNIEPHYSPMASRGYGIDKAMQLRAFHIKKPTSIFDSKRNGEGRRNVGLARC